MLTVPLSLVVSGKPVPPRASVRQRVSIRDAEAHTSKTGTEYVRFSIAVRPAFGEEPLWVDVVLYGALIEVAKKLDLAKGDLVTIVGKLNAPRVKDGKAFLQAIADEVRLLARPRAEEAPAA